MPRRRITRSEVIVPTGEPVTTLIFSGISYVLQDLLGFDPFGWLFGSETRISHEKDQIEDAQAPYFQILHDHGYPQSGPNYSQFSDARHDLLQDPIVWQESQSVLSQDMPGFCQSVFGGDCPEGYDERFVYQFWDNAWGDGFTAVQRIAAWDGYLLGIGVQPVAYPVATSIPSPPPPPPPVPAQPSVPIPIPQQPVIRPGPQVIVIPPPPSPPQPPLSPPQPPLPFGQITGGDHPQIVEIPQVWPPGLAQGGPAMPIQRLSPAQIQALLALLHPPTPPPQPPPPPPPPLPPPPLPPPPPPPPPPLPQPPLPPPQPQPPLPPPQPQPPLPPPQPQPPLPPPQPQPPLPPPQPQPPLPPPQPQPPLPPPQPQPPLPPPPPPPQPPPPPPPPPPPHEPDCESIQQCMSGIIQQLHAEIQQDWIYKQQVLWPAIQDQSQIVSKIQTQTLPALQQQIAQSAQQSTAADQALQQELDHTNGVLQSARDEIYILNTQRIPWLNSQFQPLRDEIFALNTQWIPWLNDQIGNLRNVINNFLDQFPSLVTDITQNVITQTLIVNNQSFWSQTVSYVTEQISNVYDCLRESKRRVIFCWQMEICTYANLLWHKFAECWFSFNAPYPQDGQLLPVEWSGQTGLQRDIVAMYADQRSSRWAQITGSVQPDIFRLYRDADPQTTVAYTLEEPPIEHIWWDLDEAALMCLAREQMQVEESDPRSVGKICFGHDPGPDDECTYL